MNDPRAKNRRWLVLSLVVAIALVVMLRWPAGKAVTIGVEGRRTVEIAGPRLTATPFTFGDPLAVRIAGIEPTPAGFRYDLRYMAYGPGEFDLADYLLQGTQRPPRLASMPIEVASILPADHQGELFDAPKSFINVETRYRTWMGLMWVAWGVLLLPLLVYGRRRHRSESPPPPPPTVPQRLRALLELAEISELSPQQQAELEKLLLAFWARRLNLSTGRLVDALAQVRRHPSASGQVERLEHWLHSRTPDTRREVARDLLEQLSGEFVSNGNGTRLGGAR
jgi:hypothetical protein